MKHHWHRGIGPTTAVALMALCFVGSAPSAAAAAATVTVRIEGAKRTLLKPTRVPLTSRVVGLASSCGPVQSCTLCPGSSGLGALDGATRGRWLGTAMHFPDYGYEVRTILGETHRPDLGSGNWTGFLNDHFLGTFCDAGLRPGDSVVFFPHAAPDTVPLGLTAPRHVQRRGSFIVKVVAFDYSGIPTAVSGALVTGGEKSVRTNAAGRARIRPGAGRRLRLRASKHNLVRTEVHLVTVGKPRSPGRR